jgi:tRNA 2-thiocytidine biosynthesis protein TtcA
MIKAMLQEWERTNPGRLENIFRAICNVVPSHMLDKELHDFPGLALTRHLDVVNL